MPDEPLRAFVALELPDAALAALPAPGQGWRPVPREALHVTLAFLGWIGPAAVPAIGAALEEAAAPVGEVSLGSAVVLPPRRPRVLVVDLEDPQGRLRGLQQRVSGLLRTAGLYEPERREYRPHVTIGRAREAKPPRGPLPEVEPVRFQPGPLTLFQSRLHPSGARYEPLVQVEL